ncbi:ABC transporter permease [Gelidibacter japonicus]|jgi:iron(III) transport system permease protein|uniref:ABC transporter permease n=1 Tax=Gelidibacter japonicus TaxID=1962232 RepID=UPI0013D1BA4D|nr:iron ABC transporter permease [Gelidibacter japonicus]MCL8008658.1 iron ABC transporter permease [Gelidibacter japonicus]
MAKKTTYWWNKWTGGAIVILLLVLTPVFTILVKLFDKPGEHWRHIASNLLPSYFANSFLLLLGVGFFTFLIGVSMAWLVSVYDFPGRKYFEWLLILPLAFPSYMMAYSYVGILEYTGPVQAFFRNNFDIHFKGAIVDIMNMPGAIFILSISLFPYVYVICRASFTRQSSAMQEAAFLLGSNRMRMFTKIALPMARPAVAGGIALVGMEVLNDYGTVKYFGVDTFTSGIFRAWFSFGDINTAIYLSAILTVIVLALIWLENFQRGSRNWNAGSGGSRPALRIRPKYKSTRRLYTALCLTVLLISFIFPLMQLFYWVSLTWQNVVDSEFGILIFRSFSLAIGSAVAIAVISIFLLYAIRLSPLKWTKHIARTASLGYAIPGAVIAVGVMIPMMGLDRTINWAVSDNMGMILSGTLFILVVAYIVRFMAVGYNAIDAGFQKTGATVNEVARSLGASPLRTLWKIDLPLIKNSIAGAVLLAFVDILKELPLTLILRPFNFHTLATKAFDMATNEMIAESANASLVVVLTGVIPIIVLNNMISRKK